MKPQERFTKLRKKYQNDPEYITEGVLIDINEQIVKLLEERGLSQSAFADLLDVSSPYISKLLNGNENLTIKQLVKIAMVLECSIDVALVPKQLAIHRLYTHVPATVDTKGFDNEFKLATQPNEPYIPIAA